MQLFKYLHPDRIDVLRNGRIRFSSPKVLNDPFELKPHVSRSATKTYLETEIEHSFPTIVESTYLELPAEFRAKVSLQQFQIYAQTQLPEAMLKIEEAANSTSPIVQQVMAETFENMIGMLCLTESPANLLMWAHYADSHQGFVVEFDSTDRFFDQRKNPDDEFRYLRKVTYSNLRPSLTLGQTDGFSPFLTKGLDWRYETEWRMMLPLAEADQVVNIGPTTVHLFSYPRSAIRSVILGCRVTEAVKHNVLETIRTVDDLQGVLCYQTSIDEEHYRLQVTPIHD